MLCEPGHSAARSSMPQRQPPAAAARLRTIAAMRHSCGCLKRRGEKGFETQLASAPPTAANHPQTRHSQPQIVYQLSHPQGIKIAFIAGGSTAAHCIAADVAGACYTWGRNEVRWRPPAHACSSASTHCSLHSALRMHAAPCLLRLVCSLPGGPRRPDAVRPTPSTPQSAHEHALLVCKIRIAPPQKGQLGHGDLMQRNVPTKVAGLDGKFVVKGEYRSSCEHVHTVLQLCLTHQRHTPCTAGFGEPVQIHKDADEGAGCRCFRAPLTAALTSLTHTRARSRGRQGPHRGCDEGRPVLCLWPQHTGALTATECAQQPLRSALLPR